MPIVSIISIIKLLYCQTFYEISEMSLGMCKVGCATVLSLALQALYFFQDLFKLSKRTFTECAILRFILLLPMWPSKYICYAGGRHEAVAGPRGWLSCPRPEWG